MQRDVSYASAGFMDRDIEAALAAIAAAGFSQTELSALPPHISPPPDGQALSVFRAGLEARGLRVRTVHAPMGRNVLGAEDEEWRRQNIPTFTRYLHFAGAVGAGDMVVHPFPNPMFVTDPKDPTLGSRLRDGIIRSLDELVPVMEASGVRLLLENLPYPDDYPLDLDLHTMEALRPLVDPYPAAAIGLVLDTGHAGTSHRDPASEIRTAGSRLWGTHLQDVDRDEPSDNHWVPTQGGLDWDAIRQALDEVNYAGAWTFEVINARRAESPEELAQLSRQVASAWGLDDR